MKPACRQPLNSPIPSIRTPFLESGEVDYAGLREMVEFCITSGAQALMLTAGDSHYLCLSDAEIDEVTRVTCEQTKGRAYIICADRNHGTAAACDLARRFLKLGADLFMSMPCDWAGSTTTDSLALHYKMIGEIMPVMIVTNIFIPRGVAFGLAAVKKTLDAGANVVALKDDMAGVFIERLCLNEHERIAIVAGGTKQLHLHMSPFGVDGYLSTMATYRPDIAQRYWAAMQSNNLAEAREIVRTIDQPFFEHIMGYAGGFDACMYALAEVRGLAGRWRRAPYHALTDEEMERFRGFLAEKGLLP